MAKEIRSKYQKKTLEIIEYNLKDEYSCARCDKPFLIDESKCLEVYDEDEADNRIVVYCPYCGQQHRILL